MSFDRLNSLESQPTTFRRSDDPQYRDDPEFDRLTEGLSNQLFTLTSNITRLSDQVALLGTRRDTERVRERVHKLLEDTRAGFRDVAEGIKKVQTWEDVSVCYVIPKYIPPLRCDRTSSTNVFLTSLPKNGLSRSYRPNLSLL